MYVYRLPGSHFLNLRGIQIHFHVNIATLSGWASQNMLFLKSMVEEFALSLTTICKNFTLLYFVIFK